MRESGCQFGPSFLAQKLSGCSQKRARLLQHFFDLFGAHQSFRVIVLLDADIEGVDEPAMELGIEQAGLRELFAVSCMQRTVLAELLIALVEQSFRSVE